MEKKSNLTAPVIGVVLILVGILSLFGRLFSFDMDNVWPLVVVAVGLAFFAAMMLGDKSRAGLAVPGSIITTVGLISFVCNLTYRWEVWSYAWALIPCAAGVGTFIQGYRSENPELRNKGLKSMRESLVFFLVLGVIMEFIFSATGVSDWGGQLLWSALLILVGLFLLVSRLLSLGKPTGEPVDLFWPVLMVGVGAIALLAYFKWLPEGNLVRLASLWPLLLIVLGVGIMFRKSSHWVSLVLGLVVVGLLFVVAFAGAQLGLPSEPAWFSDIDFEFGGNVGEKIIGSGKITTEGRSAGGVEVVRFTLPGKLEIIQGTEESLTITGDDNILAVLTTDVSDGRLTIRSKPGTSVRPNQPLKFVLTVKNLEGVQVSSSGSVKIGTLSTDDFFAIISSSGNIQIDELQANDVKVTISSSGDVVMSGSAKSLDAVSSSSGSVQAGNLQVQTAKVTLSSSGNVTTWVVDKLTATLSSSGNVFYYGDPNVSDHHSSSGRLVSKGQK